VLFGPNSAFTAAALKQVNGYESSDPHIIDDVLISRKLSHAELKIAKFANCWNYHSTRRFNKNPLEILNIVETIFSPAKYHQKST
jgi:hypothetical protein